MQPANAVLTQIIAPGGPDKRGNATTGTTVWTGREPALLARSKRSGRSGGGEQAAGGMRLILARSSSAPIVEQAGPDWSGSRVVVEDRRGTPVLTEFRVAGMEHRAAGTAADHLLLDLDRAIAL